MAKLNENPVEMQVPSGGKQGPSKEALQADQFATLLKANPGKVFALDAEDDETDRMLRVRMHNAVVTRGKVDKKLFRSWTDASNPKRVYVTILTGAAATKANGSGNAEGTPANGNPGVPATAKA